MQAKLVEVSRTCQFAATVLTPAAARSGAKASRLDVDNIQMTRQAWQSILFDF